MPFRFESVKGFFLQPVKHALLGFSIIDMIASRSLTGERISNHR
jgi:hypothetical protein